MFQRISFFLPLVFLPLRFPTSVLAQPSTSYLSEKTANGVVVTLMVPKDVYLQNALVRVTVRVQNVTRRPRDVRFPFSLCGFDAPGVSVRDDIGRLVYPPAMVPWIAAPCPAAGETLRPGQTVTFRGYAILRGAHLQQIVDVDKRVGPHALQTVEIATPPITVQLTPAPAPRATISRSGKSLSALIERPPGARGPLLYQSRADCPGGLPNAAVYVLNWTRAPGRSLSPGCAPVGTWLVAAGWLN